VLATGRDCACEALSSENALGARSILGAMNVVPPPVAAWTNLAFTGAGAEAFLRARP
jgi:hypothetical protein